MSNPLKKVVKYAKKAIKNPIKYNPFTLTGRTLYEGYDVIRDNWSDIRTPLAYAGLAAATAMTGGLAAGYTLPAAAGLAAAGAASGAAAGAQVRAGEKAAERAAAENERIAAEEAEKQRKLNLLQAGSTPEGVSQGDLEARRRMSSQYRKNQVSRQNQNKKLGGSSSTLA